MIRAVTWPSIAHFQSRKHYLLSWACWAVAMEQVRHYVMEKR